MHTGDFSSVILLLSGASCNACTSKRISTNREGSRIWKLQISLKNCSTSSKRTSSHPFPPALRYCAISSISSGQHLAAKKRTKRFAEISTEGKNSHSRLPPLAPRLDVVHPRCSLREETVPSPPPLCRTRCLWRTFS